MSASFTRGPYVVFSEPDGDTFQYIVSSLAIPQHPIALCGPNRANAVLFAAVLCLYNTLVEIAAPRDCGCRPCTGQCSSNEALLIEADAHRDIALAAIAKATPRNSGARIMTQTARLPEDEADDTDLVAVNGLDALRNMDEIIRVEARQIHVEHNTGASLKYKEHTLRGSYDNDAGLVALRSAIRRGIEIGRRL